jgi:hypothetical protein
VPLMPKKLTGEGVTIERSRIIAMLLVGSAP